MSCRSWELSLVGTILPLPPYTGTKGNTHTFILRLCLLANCVSMQKLLILAGTQVVLHVWNVYLAAHDAEWFYLQCWIVRAVKPPRMCFYCWNWNSEVGVQAFLRTNMGNLASSCTLPCSVSSLENAGNPQGPSLSASISWLNLSIRCATCTDFSCEHILSLHGFKSDTIFINGKEYFWVTFTLHVFSGSIT